MATQNHRQLLRARSVRAAVIVTKVTARAPVVKTITIRADDLIFWPAPVLLPRPFSCVHQCRGVLTPLKARKPTVVCSVSRAVRASA